MKFQPAATVSERIAAAGKLWKRLATMTPTVEVRGWRLYRHAFNHGRIESHSAPLNNVLDYSGH